MDQKQNISSSDLVPHEILNRPKQGFGVPMEQWINHQLRDRVHATLTEPRTQQRGHVEAAYINVLLDEHERGRRDHSTELWALFMLELWHRSFAESGSTVRDTAGAQSLTLVHT